jgi:hypothetical protein
MRQNERPNYKLASIIEMELNTRRSDSHSTRDTALRSPPPPPNLCSSRKANAHLKVTPHVLPNLPHQLLNT